MDAHGGAFSLVTGGQERPPHAGVTGRAALLPPAQRRDCEDVGTTTETDIPDFQKEKKKKHNKNVVLIPTNQLGLTAGRQGLCSYFSLPPGGDVDALDISN